MSSEKEYEAARQLLEQGKVAQSFDLLNQHGFIHERSLETIAYDVAEHCFESFAPLWWASKYTTTVLCSGTDECDHINAYIRSYSKYFPLISRFGDAQRIDKIYNLNLTNEEKVRGRYDLPSVPPLVIDVHQSSPGLKKGHSYAVRGVEGAGNVRLDNGALLPLNMPETFTVHVRSQRGFELCVGELVRVSHNAPTMPPTIDARTTYRVVDIRNETIFLKEVWPLPLARENSAPNHGDKVFALPVTYGRLDHAYCQTPLTLSERKFDYIYSFHDPQAAPPLVAQQFHAAVLGAGIQSVTFTHDWRVLREVVIDAARDIGKRARDVIDSQAQEREVTSLEKSVSRRIGRDVKGEFDRDR